MGPTSGGKMHRSTNLYDIYSWVPKLASCAMVINPLSLCFDEQRTWRNDSCERIGSQSQKKFDYPLSPFALLDE